MNAPTTFAPAEVQHPMGAAFDMLELRATQLGHAKALLRNFLDAADAETAEQRAAFMNYAIARARRELAEGGRLA